MMGRAAATVAQADAVLVVGTSMQVYPAAGLIDTAPSESPLFMINPDEAAAEGYRNMLDTFYCAPASEGVPQWAADMRRRFDG